MIKEVLNRRIPQILGSYIVAGTSLVLFMDWLSARYEFPQYYVTIALFGIVSIIPSVLILAYFHGAPGKDEWNKLEKVGIPINMIFIGIMILLGNNFNWWLDNVSMDSILKEKRLLIAEITSNVKNVEFAKMMVKKYEGISDPQITLLTKDEKNNIYDELITYLEMNKLRDDIQLYTKYQLEEEANKKGKKIEDYVFTYLIKHMDTGMEDWLEIHKERINDEKSLYNYMKNTSSDFGYFPLIYINKYLIRPLKGLEHLSKDQITEKYVVIHSLSHEMVEYKDGDESRTFHHPHSYKLLNGDELIEYMGEYIYNTIKNYTSTNQGEILDILGDNKILFKYDKNKNQVLSRMVLDTWRIYSYDSKLDDFDDFINMRIDDLLTYEFYVDKDSTSQFYHDYYGNNGPDTKSFGLFDYTKDELRMLFDGTHIFFNNENKNIKSKYPMTTNIKIKVVDVYDSTATALIYKKDNPNIMLKVGDIVKY